MTSSLGRMRLRTEYLGNGTSWVQQNQTEYIYDGMRVIQERDSNNVPTAAYTRGTDLSGSMEGAGGIGGLLARSGGGVLITNTTLNIYITNGSSLDFTFWIYTASATNVNGVTISAGTDATFSFTGYAGVGYTVYGIDSVYGVEEVSYSFTSALDHWQFTLDKDYDFEGVESGAALAGPAGNWTRHDYYFADANGNVTSLIDEDQDIVASYRYDPFGNIISKSGVMADTSVYRFSSKEIHVPSGMYYYGYRFYDSGTQRWTSRDPIQEIGGINLFGYVGQAPINQIDSDGLEFTPTISIRDPSCVGGCDQQAQDCINRNTTICSIGGAAVGAGAQTYNKTGQAPGKSRLLGGPPSGDYTSRTRLKYGSGAGRTIGRVPVALAGGLGAVAADLGGLTQCAIAHGQCVNSCPMVPGTPPIWNTTVNSPPVISFGAPL